MSSVSEDAPTPRRTSRLLALAVLVPAVPLLLVSTGALVGFYLAPARFNAWLGRLPGDELIRTALIFAPATLVAVVVMAVLYANEAPRREAAEATRPTVRRGELRRRQGGAWARRSLWITVPLLVLAGTGQAIEFVAPERVARLLDLLPATALLTRIFGTAPLVALAAVGLGLIFGFVPGESGPTAAGTERGWSAPRIARLGAQLTLLPALGLLVLSGAGLALVAAAPERLTWLIDRLPAETLLRLGLAFAPAMFLGIVLLAGLYLTASRTDTAPEASRRPSGGLRSALALGVLLAGLGFTVVTGTGVLAALLFLLVGG